MILEELSRKIFDIAYKLHTNLGPGLFEKVYKVCFQHELIKSGLNVLSEVSLPVVYDGIELEIGYRIDLLVEDSIIIELKSVESLAPIHKAQLLNYLKLSGRDVGLLFNFNTQHLKNGIIRVVNTPLPPSSPSLLSR